MTNSVPPLDCTPKLTRERIEEFRREYRIPAVLGDGKPLEPWAVEENQALDAICDAAQRTASYSDFNRVMEFAAVICDELSINATNDPYCQAAMHCAAVIRAKKK